MYVGRTVLLGLLCLSCCSCASNRIWYTKHSCAKRDGFTCLPKIGEKSTLIFECPLRTREYHIYINEFNGPRTLENLIVRNCEKLTILFRCTRFAWEKKNMRYVEVSNIDKLRIQNVPNYQTVLPPKMVLRNIKQIDSILGNTFTQTNRRNNPSRCHLPSYTFRSLLFHNISINSIQPLAIYMPNNFLNLTFSHVRVKKIDTSSVMVNHDPTGLFLFDSSTVELIKPTSIEVTGRKVTFSKNLFLEILSEGIKVQSNEFHFLENEVASTLQSDALSVTSEQVLILKNVFKFMSISAFSHIGSSGLVKWYEFSGNTVEFLEEGALLPNLNTLNVSDQIRLHGNQFHCDCFLTGSLLSKIETSTDDIATDGFYKKLFEEQSENVCISTCNLTLSSAKKKFVNGTCMDSITVDNLCKDKEKTTQLVPSSPTQVVTALPSRNNTSTFSSTPPSVIPTTGGAAGNTTPNWVPSEYNTTVKSDTDNAQTTDYSLSLKTDDHTTSTDSFSSSSTPIEANTVELITSPRTSLYNSTNKVLTNATLPATTVPPTKLTPRIYTKEEQENEDSTTIRGPQSFTSLPEKSKTNSSLQKILENSSHINFICSPLLLVCVTFYTIYSGY